LAPERGRRFSGEGLGESGEQQLQYLLVLLFFFVILLHYRSCFVLISDITIQSASSFFASASKPESTVFFSLFLKQPAMAETPIFLYCIAF
jgi:hypothetical protein